MGLDELLNEQNRAVDPLREALVRRMQELQNAAIEQEQNDAITTDQQKKALLKTDEEKQNQASEDNV